MVSSRLVTRYNRSDLYIIASLTAQASVEQKVLASDHCAEKLVNWDVTPWIYLLQHRCLQLKITASIKASIPVGRDAKE